MRILIFGSGGVGAYFGGHLAAAGNDVTFIARGKHLQTLQTNGLTIESSSAPLHREKVVATDDPTQCGEFDVVMLCTKLWEVENAAHTLKPLLKKDSVVISFQNGVDSPQILTRILGPQHVLGGIAYIISAIKAPGIIKHTGAQARLRVGAFAGGPLQAAKDFVALSSTAKLNIELVDDIHKALWEKFVFLSAFSGMTCLVRQPIGVIRHDPDLYATLQAVLTEAWQVAQSQKAGLPQDFVVQQLELIAKLPEDGSSSMWHDLNTGNKLEAPWLSGTIARLAKEADIPAPVSETIYAAMKPYINGIVR